MGKAIFNIIGLMCVLLAYVIIGFEPVCLALIYMLYIEYRYD